MLAMISLIWVTDLPPRLELTVATVWFLLLLYSLWGAVDTLLGYDFRYIVVANLVEKVAYANLNRASRNRSSNPNNASGEHSRESNDRDRDRDQGQN